MSEEKDHPVVAAARQLAATDPEIADVVLLIILRYLKNIEQNNQPGRPKLN